MIRKAKAKTIDREELAARLLELGRKVLEMEAIEAEMQKRIDAVRAQYSSRLERRAVTIREMEADLRLACEDSREDLLPRSRKSVDVLFGRVGWRSQPPKVVQERGIDALDTIMDLSKHSPDLLRRKVEVDRQAVLGALRLGDVTEEQLGRWGLEVRSGRDDWYYELHRDSIRDATHE